MNLGRFANQCFMEQGLLLISQNSSNVQSCKDFCKSKWNTGLVIPVWILKIIYEKQQGWKGVPCTASYSQRNFISFCLNLPHKDFLSSNWRSVDLPVNSSLKVLFIMNPPLYGCRGTNSISTVLEVNRRSGSRIQKATILKRVW